MLRLPAASRAQRAPDAGGKHAQHKFLSTVCCARQFVLSLGPAPRLRRAQSLENRVCPTLQEMTPVSKNSKENKKALSVFQVVLLQLAMQSYAVWAGAGAQSLVLTGKITFLIPTAFSVLLGVNCAVGCGFI